METSRRFRAAEKIEGEVSVPSCLRRNDIARPPPILGSVLVLLIPGHHVSSCAFTTRLGSSSISGEKGETTENPRHENIWTEFKQVNVERVAKFVEVKVSNP